MDYESRHVKWYWLLLFLIYSGGVVYILFQGNPYLYSHLELRSALLSGADAQLQTIPTVPTVAKVGQNKFYSRYNFERTAVDTLGSPRSKNYTEYEKFPVETGIEGWEPLNIAHDEAGFYVTAKSEWAVAIGLDGKARWKYKFLQPTGERSLQMPMIDEANVYLVHPQGEVVALDKMTGEIRWLLPLNFELVAAPFIWNAQIVLPIKAQKGLQFVLVNRANGEKAEKMPTLDIKPGFQISRATAQGNLIATVDNKVISIDPETWTIEWSQTLTEPTHGPAVVVDSSIYIATLGAKLMRLDGSKKGKLDWELELEKPAASPPSYLPIMNRLAFLDTSGALVVVDAKLGKSMWRYGIENRNTLNETWSARIKGNHIEEFKMDWLHKGWTVWSPCAQNRFCIFTPNKGQMIERILLSGDPLALPLIKDRRWVFLVKGKNDQYFVSHSVEEGEIKALLKAKGEEPPN